MRKSPPKRQKPSPAPESAAPADRRLAAAATSARLSPAMPGPAAGEGKVPFRNAKEEIRVGFGVQGSEGGGGGREKPGARGQRQDIVWRNVFLMSLLHLGAVYSLVLIPKAQPLTLLWGKFRRRPLRPGHRGEAAPGRAGSRVAAGFGRCGAPLCSLLASPPRAPVPRPAVVRPLGQAGISVLVFSTSASPAVSLSRRLWRRLDGLGVLRRYRCAQRHTG